MSAPRKTARQKTARPSTWLNVVVDYGPVVAFFVVYRWASPVHHEQTIADVIAVIKDTIASWRGHHDKTVTEVAGIVKDSLATPPAQDTIAEVAAVIKGTVAFMIGAVVAVAFSLARFKRVSPMLWLSTALILFFGGLTVFLRDSFWIQLKPTVIYVIFGVALLGGWLRGRALLKVLLETAFEGLDDAGWMILSRNWGWYFLCLAVLNEVLRHYLSFDHWLLAKLYLFLPASFLFTFAHIPMLLRHGLGAEDVASTVIADEPPTA